MSRYFLVEIDETLLSELNKIHGYNDDCESIAWSITGHDYPLDFPSKLVTVTKHYPGFKCSEGCPDYETQGETACIPCLDSWKDYLQRTSDDDN